MKKFFAYFLPNIRTQRLIISRPGSWHGTHERLWIFSQKWFPRSKIIFHVRSIPPRTNFTFQFPLVIRLKGKNAIHYPYRLASLTKYMFTTTNQLWKSYSLHLLKTSVFLPSPYLRLQTMATPFPLWQLKNSWCFQNIGKQREQLHLLRRPALQRPVRRCKFSTWMTICNVTK